MSPSTEKEKISNNFVLRLLVLCRHRPKKNKISNNFVLRLLVLCCQNFGIRTLVRHPEKKQFFGVRILVRHSEERRSLLLKDSGAHFSLQELLFN